MTIVVGDSWDQMGDLEQVVRVRKYVYLRFKGKFGDEE